MKRHSNDKGYTLVELMIAIVIGLILISAASVTYIAQNRAYITQDNISETNTQSKIAHDLIIDDIRNAGFAVPGDLDELSVNGNTSIVVPVDNTDTSDSITISSGSILAGYLQCAVVPFAISSCGLNPDAISISNEYALSTGDVINVDGVAAAMVTSTAGNVVNLDRKLVIAIDVNRPVYYIGSVTYSVDNNMDLWRNTQLIAENIEDLQFAYAVDEDGDDLIDDQPPGGGNDIFGPEDYVNTMTDPSTIRSIRLNLLARTDREDKSYEAMGNPPATIENRDHDATNDDFRRRWWQSVVSARTLRD